METAPMHDKMALIQLQPALEELQRRLVVDLPQELLEKVMAFLAVMMYPGDMEIESLSDL